MGHPAGAVEPRLWRDGGHIGFDAWLQAAGLLGRSSAYKAMLIASEFSKDQAARFGSEKLAAGVRLLAATAKEEQPGDLLAGNVTIRDSGHAARSLGGFVSVIGKGRGAGAVQRGIGAAVARGLRVTAQVAGAVRTV